MSTDPDSAQHAMQTWQIRLLPVMIRMLAGLTMFFFLASFGQLFYLHSRIEKAPSLSTTDLVGPLSVGRQISGADVDVQRLRTSTLLEANVIARRYHQANVLLMSRVWANYLGFVTGMTLALVGAAFILGQLQTAASELETKSGPAQLTLRTASPGLALSVLGVVLMITTIVTHHDIQTQDVPVYLGKEGLGAGAKPILNFGTDTTNRQQE
jgi:hypothetical protein